MEDLEREAARDKALSELVDEIEEIVNVDAREESCVKDLKFCYRLFNDHKSVDLLFANFEALHYQYGRIFWKAKHRADVEILTDALKATIQ